MAVFSESGSCLTSWRPLSFDNAKIFTLAPIIFKPVDHLLERIVANFMEVESFRTNPNEFLDHFLLWLIRKNDMLRIVSQNGKTIGNSCWLFDLLIFDYGFKLLIGVTFYEFGVSNHISHQTIARNDIPFNNFSQRIKLVVTYDKSRTNNGPFRLIELLNVNVHKILLPKFPSQRDLVLSSS